MTEDIDDGGAPRETPRLDGLDRVMADCGAMTPLLRDMDWDTTSLGPPDSWPQSLRSAASICLGAKYPIAVYWGDDLSLIYNEAWSAIPGGKHPWALGRPGAEVWPDIWHIVGPEFAKAMAGEGTFVTDRLLPMRRHGYLEETYFNYSLSPIAAEGRRIRGVFNAGLETTARVVSERRQRLLLDLTSATSRASSVEEVAVAAGNVLARHGDETPAALLYLLAGDTATLVASTAAPTPSTPTEVSLAGAGADPWHLREVAGTRAPVVVSEIGLLLDAQPAGDWPDPPEVAVTVPVLRGGPRSRRRLLGALVVAVPPGLVIDEPMRQFHGMLSDSLASALIDAQREEEERRIWAVEHRVATTLQQSLIPALPDVDHARLEARYLPGSADVEVGGDWYDAVPRPDGGVSLVIGDVVGKGVAAAAQMGQIRNAMRAYVLEGFSPGQIMERLNRVTLSVSGSTFATVLCSDYDPPTRRLRWCRAGHLPVLVRSVDGSTRFLDGAGSSPVGVFEDARYTETTIELDPGDVVLLYTDGLVERRTEDIDVGMDRLARVVSELPVDDGTLDAIVDAMVGDDRRDDVALLVLHC